MRPELFRHAIHHSDEICDETETRPGRYNGPLARWVRVAYLERMSAASRSRRRRCKVCKGKLPERVTGRVPIYCCAACRQSAYRARQAKRPALPLRLLSEDLRAIKDRDARRRGAVAVLEDLGYTVHLTPAPNQPSPRRPRPALTPVPGTNLPGGNPKRTPET